MGQYVCISRDSALLIYSRRWVNVYLYTGRFVIMIVYLRNKNEYGLFFIDSYSKKTKFNKGSHPFQWIKTEITEAIKNRDKLSFLEVLKNILYQ